MKIAKDTASKEGNEVIVLEHLPLEHIAKSSRIPNREHTEQHITDLYDSIKANGLDIPLAVWDNNGGKMKLGDEEVPARFVISGFGRREALRRLAKNDPARFKQLFPKGVPVRVRGGELQEALFAQLRENVNQAHMEPHEILPFVKRLKEEFKLEGKVIAKRVGMSAPWVSMILNIERELGDEAMEEVSKGKLSVRDAQKVAKDVKAKRKAGEAVDAKEEVKKKVASKTGQRQAKRVSPTKIWGRYKTLPTMNAGKRLILLEDAFKYIVEERSTLPKELQAEEAPKSAVKKKAA